MYASYQIIESNNLIFQNYLEIGKQLELQNNEKITPKLKTFLNPDGSIDASNMMDDWFPHVEGNVFISHARKDKDVALGLAGLLQKNGLKPFVDSCVWSHANGLIKQLDNTYCKTGENLFSYEKSLVTASHVNMMLGAALTKMMDQCECIFFLNTSNSVSSRSLEELKNDYSHLTASPWLFHELSMIQLLRRRSIEEHRSVEVNFNKELHKEAHTSVPTFNYPAKLENMTKINANRLKNLVSPGRVSNYLDSLTNSGSSILDSIYSAYPIKQ